MAAAQPQADSYLQDFGGPTPADVQVVRLPSHRDIPIPDDELVYALDSIINDYLNESKQANKDLILELYTRACHPLHDSMPTPGDNPVSDPTIYSFVECHNGLHAVREEEMMFADQICELTDRLVTWIQDQQAVEKRLGPRYGGENRWWITPADYVLQVQNSGPTLPGWHLNARTAPLADVGVRAKAHEAAVTFPHAKFTIHFVHFWRPEHWAIIIRRTLNGDTWTQDLAATVRPVDTEQCKAHHGLFQRPDRWLEL
ncbi:hypothetical protein VTK26DRAFT_9058 [Humicola hyalothermophila]